MKSKLFLLKSSAISHTYFTIGSITFIVANSIGISSSILDLAAILTFCSFFFFRRCVMIDIYNGIKEDVEEMNLPFLARDSSTRELLKKFTRKFVKPKQNPVDEDKIHSMRLDVLKNVDPFVQEDDHPTIKDMYNRKIQYIVGNIILGMVIISKYNLNKLTMVLVAWLLYTFPI